MQEPPLIERRYRNLERRDLRGGFLAARRSAGLEPGKCRPEGRRYEGPVIGGAGIEGRIKVDQVDGRVFDVIAQDVEIVAEVKLDRPTHLRTEQHNAGRWPQPNLAKVASGPARGSKWQAGKIETGKRGKSKLALRQGHGARGEWQAGRIETRKSKFETRQAGVSRCGKLPLDKWGQVVILGVGRG